MNRLRAMAPHRDDLPQLKRPSFLTDGGIETTLIFEDGLDLPDFAAFVLLASAEGRSALTKYFETYATLAADLGIGIVLETPTWRASQDWATRLGYSRDQLVEANRDAVELVAAAAAGSAAAVPIVVSGCIGPRGDGYDPGQVMTVDEAQGYHALQVSTFADSAADMASGITMTNVEEATGLALAAREYEMPVAIAFTVETDGVLPTGQGLGEAVSAVEEATGSYPAYYQINCAHPTHFEGVLATGESWVNRVRGLRVNASSMSHEELDNAEELDSGNPEELATQCRRLHDQHPELTILGGCCGTDHRHISAIGRALVGS